MSNIHIDDRTIGPEAPPYIIAELSANHNGKLETAMRIIEEAKKAGADAVKHEDDDRGLQIACGNKQKSQKARHHETHGRAISAMLADLI